MMSTRDFDKELLFDIMFTSEPFVDDEIGLKFQHIETKETYRKRSTTWKITYFSVEDSVGVQKFYSFEFNEHYDNGTEFETQIPDTAMVVCQEVKRTTREVVKVVNEWQDI